MRALNEWARQFARDYPNGKRGAESPKLCFVYHWQIVVQTFEMWYSKGILPDSGGWLDQDPALVNHDWSTLSALIAMWRNELNEVS